MAKKILNEVSFGSVTVQKLRRVTLDSNLLRTLEINEGDSLEVTLHLETNEIRLKRNSEISQNKKRRGVAKS